MLRKKKGLHYVPNKSHLENFSDVSGKVWVLNSAGKIFPTNPTNIFKEGDFYVVRLNGGGGSLVIEDTLANIEGAFAAIYKEKIAKGLELTDAERAKVAIFLGALYLRTRSYRDGMRGMLQQLADGMSRWKTMFKNNPKAREFAASMPSGGEGEKIYPDDVKRALDNADEFHSVIMMDSLPKVAQMIFDMKWCIVSAPDGKAFITSDDPFQIVRPEALKKYGPRAFASIPGLGWGDSEVTVPLSSKHAILAGWKLETDSAFEADQVLLDQINMRTGMSAKEIVANSRNVLQAIVDRTDHGHRAP
jgi:hypothetical protein